MRSLFHFLFVLFIFSTLTNVFSQDKKLSIKLSTEKNVYHIEELIVVRVQFTNFDTAQYRIEYNCSLEDDILWRLIFIDSSGYIYKHKTRMIYDCAGNPINIKPRNSYETYGAPVFTKGLKGFDLNSFLPSGKYSLFYSGLHINSDTVRFKIVSDVNNESYNKLLKLRELKENGEKIEGWREFLEDEENSIYANYAFDALVSLKKKDGKSSALKEKDIVYYFGISPDAWSTDVYLFWSSFYIQRIKGEVKMFEFLNKLIKKYPDTRVGSIAKKIIYDKKIPDFVY